MNLKIRFTKINFVLKFAQYSIMPRYKASALRGGIGNMLLEQYCIRDRVCDRCDFRDECIVQKIMYAGSSVKPGFVTTGESIGYALECEDEREVFDIEDTLTISIILYGKSIYYFHPMLQALYALGQRGLGKNQCRFMIDQITNRKGDAILDNNTINYKNYRIETLEDYVRERKTMTDQISRVVFLSPLSLKVQGNRVSTFSPETLIPALCRRLFMLQCFEGIHGEKPPRIEQYPKMIAQTVQLVQVPRYSSTHREKIILSGIRGELALEGLTEECIDLLLAGECFHVGKNTSFGFGHYLCR